MKYVKTDHLNIKYAFTLKLLWGMIWNFAGMTRRLLPEDSWRNQFQGHISTEIQSRFQQDTRQSAMFICLHHSPGSLALQNSACFARSLAPFTLLCLSGKKLKSVFDFLTYSRETWFSFSYAKVGNPIGLNEPSNEIDRVSKFDNSLSFGAKQNALRQIFFALWFFKDLFTKIANWIFFNFFYFK